MLNLDADFLVGGDMLELSYFSFAIVVSLLVQVVPVIKVRADNIVALLVV